MFEYLNNGNRHLKMNKIIEVRNGKSPIDSGQTFGLIRVGFLNG